MSDWPLPPLYEPRGPRDSDEEVVRAFLRHDGPSPHSERLHVEDRVLRADGDMPLALWVGPRTVLVLFDIPDDLTEIRDTVRQILTADLRNEVRKHAELFEAAAAAEGRR